MAPVALSRLLSLAAIAVFYASATPDPQITPPPVKRDPPAPAQSTFPATPLASKHFTYPDGIPYQVDTDQGLIRGTQFGYNKCNSTTENQDSLCQTSFFNSIDDFCLWSPPKPNSQVADWEGEMVAWCTKPGRGTRLIPEGALYGVQWIRTPAYVQAVGFIDQTKINLQAGDYGGELDPHGADLRGNPMGGIVFSTAFTGQFQQIIEWTNFMGGNAFCYKACDPANANAARYCEHIYDRIGCAYNVPNNAQNGTFEVCQGDNMEFPGVFTSNGVVMTYTQPDEALGPITSMPYTPVVPASSSCTKMESKSLYSALATVSAPGSSPTPSGSASKSASGTAKTAATGSHTGTGAGSTSTGTSNDAAALAISGMSILGVVFSALFLS